MTSRAKVARLGGLVKTKRREAGLGLRAAAQQAGVSPSTLSRLERAAATSLPDADTLTKLAKWLGMPVSALLVEPKPKEIIPKPQPTIPETVSVYLRSSTELSPETAEALSTMFEMLYQQFVAAEERKEVKP